MKRILKLAGAALLLSAPAFAGINPVTPGLPQGWAINTARGWGTITGINGNPASGMCVECHSVNPSTHISNPTRGGTVAITMTNNYDWGSHTVKNAIVNPTWWATYTNSGGGFTGGMGIRNNGEYMMRVAWPTAGVSKYDTGGATPTTSLATNITVWTNAGMVCESCHNISTNANAGTALLLGTYNGVGATQNDDLCVRCHSGNGSAGMAIAGYEAFHRNDTLLAFRGAGVRKRHHVLTGNTFGFYGTAGTDSIMWAPNFSDKLGTGAPWALSTTLTATSPIAFRNLVNVSGQGTRTQPQANADIGFVNANTVACTGCHRPHNAKSGSGAFIFRIGNNSSTNFDGNVGATGLTATSIGYGIRRQHDMGAANPWTSTKVYGEYVRLCDGCHLGYGSL